MRVIILDNPEDLAARGADLVLEALASRPNPVLGLATGSSPLPIYQELSRRVRAGAISFRHVRAFALDEYVGLDAGHRESYAAVIGREVVTPLGMDPNLVRTPPGTARSLQHLEALAREYDDSIRAAGGIDVQIAGIGTDGHLGFNEPGSSMASRTRIKRLTEQTRADNARFFPSADDVPTHCVTQGLGTISEARRIVVVATGAGKADAVAAAIEGPLTASVPASILQLHPQAIMLLDSAAASALARSDYYRAAESASCGVIA